MVAGWPGGFGGDDHADEVAELVLLLPSHAAGDRPHGPDVRPELLAAIELDLTGASVLQPPSVWISTDPSTRQS